MFRVCVCCRHTIVAVSVTFSGKVRVSTSVDDVTGWWYESSPNFAVVRGQSVSSVVAKFESSIIVDWCRRLSPSVVAKFVSSVVANLSRRLLSDGVVVYRNFLSPICVVVCHQFVSPSVVKWCCCLSQFSVANLRCRLSPICVAVRC